MASSLAPLSPVDFSETRTPNQLLVRRTDIRFDDLGDGVVRIGVTVLNPGATPSEPTTLRLQSAVLGAFVPWRELTTLDVPRLASGGRVEVTFDADVEPRLALGDISKIPPAALLTALAADDEENQNKSTKLPSEPLYLLERTTHWAGNINVMVGDHSVERHQAKALRIFPGRTNFAVFCVGSGRDAYRYELAGQGYAWDAALLDLSAISAVVRPPQADRIPLGEWIPTDGVNMLVLSVCPPWDSTQGEVAVHVEQRSTGNEAIVEFSLDADAAGSGCFTV